LINVAEIFPEAFTLGPGKRFIIWVQGCCFNCRGCISPEYQSLENKNPMAVDYLKKLILSIQDLEGITISGGEPMLQAGMLVKLVEMVKRERSLSWICFTGFKLEELLQEKAADRLSLLSQVDVLIGGRYEEELNDNIGLRGSSNQGIHFLSGIYKDLKEEFYSGERKMQIRIDEAGILAAGVPPVGFKQDLKQIVREFDQ